MIDGLRVELAGALKELNIEPGDIVLARPKRAAHGDLASNAPLVYAKQAGLPPMDLAEALNERLILRALAMDGTATGEHGIGMGKAKFMIAEHGEAVSVMRLIKNAIDPANIMNPGKILPN